MHDSLPKGGIHRPSPERLYAGTHLFLDLWDASHTDDAAAIEAAVDRAVADCGANQLFAKYCQYGDEGGVTGFSILAESHICVNTWHEERLIAIDVFFCGSLDPYKSVPAFQAAFSPSRIDISEHKRLVATLSSHRQQMSAL